MQTAQQEKTAQVFSRYFTVGDRKVDLFPHMTGDQVQQIRKALREVGYYVYGLYHQDQAYYTLIVSTQPKEEIWEWVKPRAEPTALVEVIDGCVVASEEYSSITSRFDIVGKRSNLTIWVHTNPRKEVCVLC